MVPTEPTSRERKDVFSIRIKIRDLIKDGTSGCLTLLTVGNSLHMKTFRKRGEVERGLFWYLSSQNRQIWESIELQKPLRYSEF